MNESNARSLKRVSKGLRKCRAGGAFSLSLLGFLAGPVLVTGESPQQIDYNFDIKPILSDRCYACHGPDEGARKADLRLDKQEGLFSELENGRQPIQPGNPKASEVYRRITAEDPDYRMPPPSSNLELSSKEIALIRKWIKQGGEWKPHWAFIPVERPSLPPVENEDWVRNPIDRFVLARLEAEGREPAPVADKAQLARRATFGLTGLPPTVREVRHFRNNQSPDAYPRLVDRLLASPAYGERMAVAWLDLARYADTHGYHSDEYRRTWPWRDWVIDAFNRNMPYDRFVTWQLAGDLLPNANQEQKLATAFNRLHPQTNEGGVVEEEFRVSYVADRVDTFGKAFLGLTVKCARCHDHKFDPISQKEYYQLFSFFDNIDETGQYSFFTDATPPPTLLLSDDQEEKKLADLRKAIKEKESEASELRQKLWPAFRKWLKEENASEVRPPPGVGDFRLDKIDGKKVKNHANPETPGKSGDSPKLVPGVRGKAVKLNGENGLVFDKLGRFSRTDPFSLSLWVKQTQPLENAVLVHHTRAGIDAGNRGYEVYLAHGRIAVSLTHMWPYNAIKLKSRRTLPVGEWVHLTMTYDGSSRAEGLRLYWNGKKAKTETIRDNLFKDILYSGSGVPLKVGQRFRDHGFKNGVVDEIKLFERKLTPLEVRDIRGGEDMASVVEQAQKGELSDKKRQWLFDYYLLNESSEYRDYLEQLRALRSAENELVNEIPEIMVMEEMDEPRPTYFLKRGAYDAKGERVHPGTPKAVMPFNKERFASNRLGLARWLTDRKNPLTARVAVNRYWQMHFGRGLVPTPADFGSQGDLPSHPKLLDWLAAEFMESGWDVKGLHRLIVTSATYRQSSKTDPKWRKKDPKNELLARGPKQRLSAEMLRDQALAAGELLTRKIGGRAVKPYQPKGLWKEKSGKTYKEDKGAALYRRSIYSYWKRTSPLPNMLIFDAARRSHCVVKRQETTTPLQALVLLNDPQFVEASRKMGKRMLTEGGKTVEAQIRFLFRLVTSRLPNEQELKNLEALYRKQRARFESNPEKAKAFLKVGQSGYDDRLRLSRLAAASVLANALLNFDEAVVLR